MIRFFKLPGTCLATIALMGWFCGCNSQSSETSSGSKSDQPESARDNGAKSPAAKDVSKPLTTSPATGEVISIPTGSAPVIDGKAGETEWGDALRVDFDGGSRLFLKQSEDIFYVGLTGFSPAGFACVFVNQGDDVRILHASAQLGSASHTRKGQTWEPVIQDYVWKLADKLWREEGWKATTGFSGSQEFAVSAATLGKSEEGTARIAFGYWLEGGKSIIWPKTGDDCKNERLLGGWCPSGMRFDFTKWALVSLGPAKR